MIFTKRLGLPSQGLESESQATGRTRVSSTAGSREGKACQRRVVSQHDERKTGNVYSRSDGSVERCRVVAIVGILVEGRPVPVVRLGQGLVSLELRHAGGGLVARNRREKQRRRTHSVR